MFFKKIISIASRIFNCPPQSSSGLIISSNFEAYKCINYHSIFYYILSLYIADFKDIHSFPIIEMDLPLAGRPIQSFSERRPRMLWTIFRLQNRTKTLLPILFHKSGLRLSLDVMCKR